MGRGKRRDRVAARFCTAVEGLPWDMGTIDSQQCLANPKCSMSRARPHHPVQLVYPLCPQGQLLAPASDAKDRKAARTLLVLVGCSSLGACNQNQGEITRTSQDTKPCQPGHCATGGICRWPGAGPDRSRCPPSRCSPVPLRVWGAREGGNGRACSLKAPFSLGFCVRGKRQGPCGLC